MSNLVAATSSTSNSESSINSTLSSNGGGGASELVIKPNRYHPNVASILTIYTGVHNQQEDKLNQANIYKVAKVIIHESFNSQMYLNDIALILLDRNVLKSPQVDWICWQSPFAFPPIDSTVFAVGFGNTQGRILLDIITRYKQIKFFRC